MLAQILGFTLTRTLPTKILFGVLTGAYQVYGGVVRDNKGRIRAHLCDGVNPLDLVSVGTAVIEAINSYLISGISKNATKEIPNAIAGVTHRLIGLAKGTRLLSGLTLAASMAGFSFLDDKLAKVDAKLQELQKDVKDIKDFLIAQERAQLANCLHTLREGAVSVLRLIAGFCSPFSNTYRYYSALEKVQRPSFDM